MTLPEACIQCVAALETPLACGECGVLTSTPTDELTPFQILGLVPSFAVDLKDAKRRLRRFTRLVHPDFFATADDAQRELAEQHNARLNEAYKLVTDDARRADWLIRGLGGPAEKDLGCMTQAFLMEVMEWNETLDENEPGSAAFETLERDLQEERDTIMDTLESLLDPLPDGATAEGAEALKESRKSLNALRYIDRALSRVLGQSNFD